ncbi:MAG: SLBB domain-containing protein [Akkermansia sp.]|nr:SLBB domain-containing protein [Akkermansia sp.]MCD8070851.1 SLBB domain-containing protein [Akkermansiaceae bacterium]
MKTIVQWCFFSLFFLTHFAQGASVEPRATAGGLIRIQIKGVPNEDVTIISDEYVLASSGTVSLPYLPAPVRLAGMTGQQVADKLAKLYKEAQIFSDPVFIVRVDSDEIKDRAKRYVHVTGNVKDKKNLQYREGLTLIEALLECGDITDYGSRYIQVTRGGETRSYDYFSARDRSLQLRPTDVIFVQNRPFWEGRPDKVGP